MKLKKIKEILKGEILTGKSNLDKEVVAAFGCDLMSDVLAFVEEGTVLLTGLTNPQVIRTAEMIDVFAIIFVRDKTPSEEILELAEDRGITIITTAYTLYTACGKLYEKGLDGLSIEEGIRN
ncbi:DRTGG domain-containing protein [Dethiothermospora halolimnae]|uniref:DRTGG domain-containing protein n=1 Tax=Dethiothermospora halolimnae TaxID=3114390 RepID=UPI003CCBA74B